MAIPAYYSLIQRGSSGPDVAQVQTWLNGLRDACTWHDILKVDGHFGTACEKAVTEFQLRNKLTVEITAIGGGEAQVCLSSEQYGERTQK